MILACVVLISLGGALDQVEEQGEEAPEKAGEGSGHMQDLVIAICFALITGVGFSTFAVTLKYTVDTGCNLNQATYDGCLLLFFLTLPFYIYELQHDNPYESLDYVKAIGSMLLCTFSIICVSKGIECGLAGPVLAIENTKTLILTVMACIFLK